MPVTINPAAIEPALKHTFCAPSTAYTTALALCGISWCRVFSGTQPANPTVTTGITQVHSGNISLPTGTFLAPSGGVTRLASAITFTANVSGVTAVFARFYAGTVGSGQPVMDVPLSMIAGIGAAVMSNTAMTSGATFTVNDLRFGLNTVGALSVNHAIAHYLLGMLTNKTPIGVSSAYTPALVLAAASKYRIVNEVGEELTATVPIRAYDGAAPASANDAATGTMIWTKNLASNDMFVVAGNGMALTGTMSAAASASGAPTYVRIVKPAYTETTWGSSAPECVIQAPVGPPTNGCAFSPATMTSGASANMTQFTVILEP